MEANEALCIVPATDLQGIRQALERLTAPTPKEDMLGDYLTEKQAQQLLGKKTTWFWQARKGYIMRSGERIDLPYTLPAAKIGNKTYYRRADLLKLIDNARSDR